MAPNRPHPHEKKMVGLPVILASLGDLGRLIRELDALEDAILQTGLRDKEHEVKLPAMSLSMERTLELNKINLLEKDERKLLREFLVASKTQAPVLHMSFGTDPAPAFIEKLVTWLRREIHPSVLVTVGLQPNLGVGCIVRTTNKYFDLSLKQDFIKKRDLLTQLISATKTRTPKPEQEVAV